MPAIAVVVIIREALVVTAFVVKETVVELIAVMVGSSFIAGVEKCNFFGVSLEVTATITKSMANSNPFDMLAIIFAEETIVSSVITKAFASDNSVTDKTVAAVCGLVANTVATKIAVVGIVRSSRVETTRVETTKVETTRVEINKANLSRIS